MRIDNVNNIFELSGSTEKKLVNNTEGNSSFGEFLKTALDEVNNLQQESDSYNKLLAIGEIDNIHDVTIASEKAKIALDMTLAIRNKVVEAYKEIMRMQV